MLYKWCPLVLFLQRKVASKTPCRCTLKMCGKIIILIEIQLIQKMCFNYTNDLNLLHAFLKHLGREHSAIHYEWNENILLPLQQSFIYFTIFFSNSLTEKHEHAILKAKYFETCLHIWTIFNDMFSNHWKFIILLFKVIFLQPTLMLWTFAQWLLWCMVSLSLDRDHRWK